MPVAIAIRCRLFARLREQAGTETETVEVPPGSTADETVNLSGKKTLSFWAKGDGKGYAVAVETESTAGQMPGIQPFVAGPEWKQYTFPWSDFKTDGHDVTGIAFAHAQEPGKFEFEIDEVEIK